jgi:hypothetical protein
MAEATPQDRYLGKLLAEIPEPRIRPYLSAAKGNARQALARYFWNIELCRAFYPALHALEIGLRNALDRAVIRYLAEQKTRHGKMRNSRIDSWLTDTPTVIVHAGAQASVAHALDDLVPPNLDPLTSTRRPKTHGDLVAGLSFGFWTSLLADEYGPDAKTPAELSWHHSMQSVAFPGSTHIAMGTINRQFTAIRHFRNRVFHHEPIWPKYPNDDSPDQWYGKVLSALKLLGGPQAEVPPVLHGRPKELEVEESIAAMSERLDTTIETLLARAAEKADKKAKKAKKDENTPALSENTEPPTAPTDDSNTVATSPAVPMD